MADPRNVLKRGFTITRSAEGRIIKSVKDIGKVSQVHTQLIDGVIISSVNEIRS
jgi:exonuclease VII large subunit